MIMKKNKVSLLPYIIEPVYGLSPSDPQEYGWELTSFNIPKIWEKTTGKNVVVAVIDTGCDLDHPDIQNNLLENKNFSGYNNDANDDNGHGTHVCSTIAAINNNKGIVGVSPDTKIIPIKVMNDKGQGLLDNVIEGIIWASNRGDVDFITMSLGSSQGSTELESAINYANSKGCVVFCAAGNSGTNSDILFPARYEKTISIGAIDKNLNRTSFTCSGESLDFLAPGHDILGCIPGGRYALMSGTSMSNPFAVGCACLVLSYNKKYNKFKLNDYLDYINLFKKTTLSLNDKKYKGQKKYEGYGIINVESLL